MSSRRPRMRPKIDTQEANVFSDEVISMYMKYARSPRYGYLMRNMSVRQFIAEKNLHDEGVRIYRNVKLRVDVKDQIDLSDETTGKYEFSYDSSDPNWYPKLMQEINTVIKLKEDFSLQYKGVEMSKLDGTKVLLDKKRNCATLQIGSESARPLFEGARGNGAIGKQLAKRLRAIKATMPVKKSASIGAALDDPEVRAALVANPEADESELSELDEEEKALGAVKYVEDRHVWKIYNKATASTVEDFVSHLSETPVRQWESLFGPQGVRHFMNTFMTHLNNPQLYGAYARKPAAGERAQRFATMRPNPNMFFESGADEQDGGASGKRALSFGGKSTNMFGDQMLPPSERRQHYTYESAHTKPISEQQQQQQEQVKADKEPLGVKLERCVMEFWRDAGLKNVNAGLNDMCQQFVRYLKHAFGKHLQVHGAHVRSGEKMVQSFKKYLQIRRNSRPADKANGEVYYGQRMKQFINKHRHPLVESGAIRVVKRTVTTDEQGRQHVDEEWRTIPFQMRSESSSGAHGKKAADQSSSSAEELDSARKHRAAIGTESSDESDEEQEYAGEKRKQESDCVPDIFAPKKGEKSCSDAEAAEGQPPKKKQQQGEPDTAKPTQPPPLPDLEERDDDVADVQSDDSFDDDEEEIPIEGDAGNWVSGDEEMFAKAVKAPAHGAYHTRHVNRYVDKPPALVPIQSDLNDEEDDAVEQQQQQQQPVRRAMPQLEPIEDDLQEAADERIGASVIDASMLLQDLSEQDELVRKTQSTSAVQFADDDVDDEEEEEEAKMIENESATTQEYTAEELALLSKMPALEPLAASLSNMPVLEPLSAAASPNASLSKMPALEALDRSAIEIEPRVQKLSLTDDEQEQTEQEQQAVEQLVDASVVTQSAQSNSEMSITQSMVAARGMNFNDFMNFKQTKMQQKKAEEQTYSTSASDCANFERDFDKYMQMVAADGETHMQRGAMILAPASSVYSEQLSKAAAQKFDKKAFKQFIEFYIVLPEASQSKPQFDFGKNGKMQVRTKNGRALTIAVDRKTKQMSLEGHARPALAKPQKSTKHKNVYFVTHQNLFK